MIKMSWNDLKMVWTDLEWFEMIWKWFKMICWHGSHHIWDLFALRMIWFKIWFGIWLNHDHQSKPGSRQHQPFPIKPILGISWIPTQQSQWMQSTRLVLGQTKKDSAWLGQAGRDSPGHRPLKMNHETIGIWPDLRLIWFWFYFRFDLVFDYKIRFIFDL